MKDPEQTYTDKKLLMKGIRRMAFSIILIVITTYLFTFTFLNKETLPLYIVLPLAIIMMGITIYFLFSGLRSILNAVFGKKSK